MDAKKSDEGEAHKSGMKTKIVGILAIAGLIVMVVFVGTAAANGDASIYGSRYWLDFEKRHDFNTTDNLYAHGYCGFYSDPPPPGLGGRVYVVEHRETWTNGTPLIDVSSDGYETLPGSGTGFFVMTWPKPLTPGTYDLVLDLNVTGTENYYVWTNITNTLGYGPDYLVDPIWTIYVTGPPGPEILIDKTASTNGVCPGSDPLIVSIGDTVTYCFNVTNIGDVTLENVAVFDDHYNEILLANTSLAPGDSLTNGTITHIVTVLDIPSVTNTVTVDSTDPDNKPVNDSDNCTLIVGYNASIEIVKTAYITGSCPGSPELEVDIDDTVTYCFDVTNTGDVTLSNVTVSDDHYGVISLGSEILTPGQSINGTATHTVNESDIPFVMNTVTVTATDPYNNPVNNTDTCTLTVVGYNANIEIVKTAYITGSCPGDDPLTVHIGDTVTYCFDVTNTGDVTLTDITVEDDICGDVTLGTLGPGKSTSGTLTHDVTAEDFPKVINTATVTGTDPLGGPVSDSDICTINGEYRPGIEIIKTAFISGSCPGTDPLNVNIGDNVTYCFNVTNTGDVALTDITVDDDIYGPVELEMDMLEPGESLTNETITHTVSALDIPSVTNTATVNATYPDNKPVNDTDNCTITVDYNASIEIVKTAYIAGSCPGTDPLTVHIGDFVTYCFNVTNTGDVTLTNLSVFDDHYGVIRHNRIF